MIVRRPVVVVAGTARHGLPPRGRCHPTATPQQNVRVYRLEEFAVALNASGATAVLMLNMLTRGLDDQLAYLHFAASVGVLRAGTHVTQSRDPFRGVGVFLIRSASPHVPHACSPAHSPMLRGASNVESTPKTPKTP